MTQPRLASLAIENFRSIKGSITVPLDGQVVLLHGENGAGKTSVLSALELALTGQVSALQLADAHYKRQLLHKGTTGGSVALQLLRGGETESFGADLDAGTTIQRHKLPAKAASFFSDRCYLPQSLLSQLLRIYQEAGPEAASPLAEFVNDLLGLDRLDAIEAGLYATGDLRNYRKLHPDYPAVEDEARRLRASIARAAASEREIRQARDQVAGRLSDELATLELEPFKDGDDRDRLAGVLAIDPEGDVLRRVADTGRHLDSLRRELERLQPNEQSPVVADLVRRHQSAIESNHHWSVQHAAMTEDFMRRLEQLSSRQSGRGVSEDPFAAVSYVRDTAKAEGEQVNKAIQAAALGQAKLRDIRKRLAAIGTERTGLEQQAKVLGSNGRDLAALLSQLTAFVDDEHCPVCERDYREVSKQPLAEQIAHRVRSLSAGAAELLRLGRETARLGAEETRLAADAVSLAAGEVDPAALAEFNTRRASLGRLAAEAEGFLEEARTGTMLAAAETNLRIQLARLETDLQARAAAERTVAQFAASIPDAPLIDRLSPTAALDRISDHLERVHSVAAERHRARSAARELLHELGERIREQANVADARRADEERLKAAQAALDRADKVRRDAQAILEGTKQARSAIIREVFNERLNALWRDLFVRLAPGEPFVPAFQVPETTRGRLVPALHTLHRAGGKGGTPGAMLSAGNLNTAALTLFLSFHLSVPKQLPWLVLDDPVQSMDDVHVSQFAALLRTISKDAGRQVVIAVHDRQLFEYLALELSPAFPGDTLITVRLARDATGDTYAEPKVFGFEDQQTIFGLAA